jgi:maltose alpha-D-glucosyltransferase / alpha-amylase
MDEGALQLVDEVFVAGESAPSRSGVFLVDVAHFQNAPALLGTVELVEGEARTALAVVHEFVSNQGDAWTITGAALDRFIDEQRLLTEETAAANPETASMLQRMRQIGRRTAELHLALTSRSDIAAFAPEPICAADTVRWTEAHMARARSTFALLECSLKNLPEPARPLAEHLLAQRDAVSKHIEAARDATYQGMKIRHHGDFHLGQVLIAKDDAYILDFEGETRRTLEERRGKEPPARDVAGFLRSIDYAVSAALSRVPNLTPEERTSLTERTLAWGDKLATSYWESYRETLGASPLWPADEAVTRALLDRFVFEKALYEVEYEVGNRPAWAHIPIEAVLRMLSQRGVTGP